MALADPVALELGALAERLGSFTPEVRVEAALGATELQGRVVVLAFPLSNPDDDAAAQQRQLNGVALSHRPLGEPDAAAFGLGEADAERLAAAFDHLGPERHLDLHPIDPGWKRARAVGRHGTVVAQRRLAGNPQIWRFIPCRTRPASPSVHEVPAFAQLGRPRPRLLAENLGGGLLPGQRLVGVIGDVEHVVALQRVAPPPKGPATADLGVGSQGVRVGQGGLPEGTSLTQQPTSEVVEAVVAAAAVDQVGGSPQLPTIGLGQQLPTDTVPCQHVVDRPPSQRGDQPAAKRRCATGLRPTLDARACLPHLHHRPSGALLHLARRCSWRVAKWSHFPSRRLPEVLKAVNLWHRRWRSGTLVEDAGLSDRQMQQCRLGRQRDADHGLIGDVVHDGPHVAAAGLVNAQLAVGAGALAQDGVHVLHLLA